MKQEKVDVYWIRDFFGEPQPMQPSADAAPQPKPPPKPDLSKYEKMKKMRIPLQAIRNKMKQEKVDPYWIRDFFGEPQPANCGKTAVKKKPAKSAIKMKALHWTRINGDEEGECNLHMTVWAKQRTPTPKARVTSGVTAMLQRCFSQTKRIKKKKKAKNASKKESCTKEISLIDPKRA